jgi:hypothetical protein
MFNSGHGFSNVDTLSHIPVSSGIIFKELCRMDWRRVCCQLRGINPLKGERNADPIARLSICPAAVAPVAGLYVYGGSDAGPGDGGEYQALRDGDHVIDGLAMASVAPANLVSAKDADK